MTPTNNKVNSVNVFIKPSYFLVRARVSRTFPTGRRDASFQAFKYLRDADARKNCTCDDSGSSAEAKDYHRDAFGCAQDRHARRLRRGLYGIAVGESAPWRQPDAKRAREIFSPSTRPPFVRLDGREAGVLMHRSDKAGADQ